MRVIEGGNVVFDALAYGVDQRPETTNYFRQEIENIGTTLTDVGRNFFSNARTLYDNINNSEVMRMARSAIQTAATLFTPNVIMPLISLEQFQTAGLVMQRFIMANPVVREKYHAQQCQGYSETYIDMYPKDIGESHYDYRRVMTGVIQEDSDNESWSVKFYPDDLVEGDKELMHDEKVDIIKTWDYVNLFIESGDKDPTCPYGSKL